MNRTRIILVSSIFFSGSALHSAEPAVFDRAISLPGQSIWLRQLVKFKEQPSRDVRLAIVGEGVASVYVNGQRLARAVELEKSPVVWDITKLVRAGRNSVTLTFEGARKSKLIVELLGGDGKLPVDAWKSVINPPPVGWQQTDFNDRDWKPVELVPSNTPSIDFKSARKLEWSKGGKTVRVVDGKLQFRNGDHVLLLGGTFIERAQSYGHLESALNCSTTDSVTFRNLGWSADTVFAESRGFFDSPEKGYERMIEHVRAEEPNVILICYGQNAVMEGAWDADRFTRQLARLCTDLRTTDAEIVLLSPHPFLDVDRAYPSPARWNDSLQEVAEAVKKVAASERLHFVSLFDNFVQQLNGIQSISMRSRLLGNLALNSELQQMEQDSWSDNGMHWTAEGYARVSRVVASRLLSGIAEPTELSVDLRASTVSADSGEVRNVKWMKNAVQFDFKAASVSPIPVFAKVIAPEFSGDLHLSSSLASPALKKNLEDLPDGAPGEKGAFLNPEYERLRRLTVRKNELYFYRWRPQNITYLYGFRKHEQGNNASEIARFDPLISSLEKQITSSKQPQWQTITIAPQKGQ